MLILTPKLPFQHVRLGNVLARSLSLSQDTPFLGAKEASGQAACNDLLWTCCA